MRGILKISIIILFVLCVLAVKASAEEVLSWQDCVKEAAKNHPDLISAEENVKQQEASKKITASTLFPQLDSSVDASRAGTTSMSSGNKTKRTTNSFSYGVTGDQLLFDGLKTLNNVKAASENIKAAQYNYRFTSSEVRLRLRAAFINLLKAQELLNITQEIYNIRRSNLELITLRYESGLEHRGALLNAEANLAQAQFEISQAKRAFEVTQRQLLKEMGRGTFSQISAKGDFKIEGADLEKPDFEVLANKNPSLSKFIAQTNAALFGIKATEANFFPKLSAQAGAGRSGARFLPQNDQWNAGLTMSFPLFEGGLRLAQVAEAKSLFHQARENERSTKDSITVGLQQAWAALQDAIETVEVQNKFLAAAIERSKIAEAQYSLGLIQFDNWTIIEDNLVSAKKVYLNARTNALLAEASWVQAKGEVLEYAE